MPGVYPRAGTTTLTKPLPTDGLGVYYVDQEGQPRSAIAGVSYNVVWDGTLTQILGIHVGINNMGFYLAVSDPVASNMKSMFPDMDYRLGGISFTEKFVRDKPDRNRKFIMLGWRLPYTEKARNVIVGPSDEVDKRFKNHVAKTP